MGIRRGSVFAAGLLAAGLLGGCGSSGGGKTFAAPSASGSAPVTSAAPAPSAGSVAPAPSVTGLKPAPSCRGPTFGAATETIVGDIQDGVEPNCVLLRTSSNKLYQLVGGDRSKLQPAGRHLTIDGHSMTGMATTCQQGTPFFVVNIRTS